MNLKSVLVFGALVSSVAGIAHGQIAQFTISGGDPTTTFALPLNPTPDYVETLSSFGLDAVPATVGGSVTSLYELTFYNDHSEGGGGLSDAEYFALFASKAAYILGKPNSVQYYSGPESDPTFLTGVYANQYNAFTGHTDTLTITMLGGGTSLAAPEPAAWTLSLFGMAGLGGTLRTRRRSTLSRLSPTRA